MCDKPSSLHQPRFLQLSKLQMLPLSLWRMKGVSTNIRLLARAYAGMLLTANASWWADFDADDMP